MSGLWTSHQKYQIISIHVGIPLHKILELGALRPFFCIIGVLLFAAVTLWHLRPLGWMNVTILTITIAAGLLGLLESTEGPHPGVYTPTSHSRLMLLSKQMLTISFINKTSHSTTVTISQMPQSFGWSRRIWIPNHPPHCITRQNEKRLGFEHVPILTESLNPHPHNSSYLSTHFWRKHSKEKSVRPQR